MTIYTPGAARIGNKIALPNRLMRNGLKLVCKAFLEKLFSIRLTWGQGYCQLSENTGFFAFNSLAG
jgi:hypothetical protein